MNESIFYFFYNFAHQSIIFDKLVVFTAVYFPYVVAWLAMMFLLFHHDVFKYPNFFQVLLQKKKEILLSFFSGSVAWVVARILKVFIHTERPFVLFQDVEPLLIDNSFAFPSGHAAFFMALAISLFFYHKKVGYLFMFFALLIGAARVVAGVHFPLDILGGFVLGVLIAYFLRNI